MQTPRQGKTRNFYRRHHKKADGRHLFLYGWAPHEGAAFPELLDSVETQTELRFHPLRQDWNIYAPHRQNRTYKPAASGNPLSPTRNAETVTEIPFLDFELAVFENRFPSLQKHPGPDSAVSHSVRPATGAAEVVVFSPEAEGSLATLDQERRVLLIEALIDRYAEHFSSNAAYVLPFENRGDAVGVTLSHPHGQIYAFPLVPEPQRKAEEAFAAGFDLEAARMEWANDHHIETAGGVHSYCPPFARFPYEVWLSTSARRNGPWDCTGEEVEGLAHLIGTTVRRYDQLFEQDMPYMMSIHAAPKETSGEFQFTVQFYPLMRSAGRLKYLAGIEQATGMFTVDVAPEAAARALRAIG